MKFRQKLYLGFAIPLVALGATGIYSIYAFWRINHQITTIYDDRVVPLTQLKAVSDEYAINIIDAVNKADDNQISNQEASRIIREAQRKISEYWGKYKQTVMTEEERKIAQATQALFLKVQPSLEELEQIFLRGDRAALSRLDGELYTVIDPITEQLKQLTELQLTIAAEERQKATQIYQETLWLFIPLLVLAIAVGSPLGFLIIRKGITAALQEVIEMIAVSSNEIDSIAQEQERIVNQQAASVNQTTISVDELSQTSKQLAEQSSVTVGKITRAIQLTQTGNEAAAKTLEEIENLNEQVHNISLMIEELRQHAQQIGTISQLVNNLGNQTNMLALNAAVEAVRAGEDGQGFNVVATEIRKLADQSRDAAVQINHLVTDIQKAIANTVVLADRGKITTQNGLQTVETTAQSFLGVNNSLEEVFLNNQQNALSAQQQEQAIAQILIAMNTLNNASQITANGISQIKTGTEHLKIAAERLKLMV